ncbi:MAG: transglycosylase SLT domain-containing protein [Alphaproteobacteria bacterium]|nr:transglycosylase SLT domain-containing protein [Alphaproteobacteria bacterium]
MQRTRKKRHGKRLSRRIALKALPGRRALGAAGIALVVSCIGTALASSLPLPVHPPANMSAEAASHASVLAMKTLPRHKPAVQALEEGAAEAATRLPGGFHQKAPSLFQRVMGHLGSGVHLSDDDAARYAHIFAFQDVGDFAKANAEIEKLTDFRLMGHVLFQRYMSDGYTSSYAELSDWMKRYGGLPDAQKIYELALRKRPKNAAYPAKPHTGRGIYSQYDFDVGQLAQPYIATRRHSARQRQIIHLIDRLVPSSPTAALRHLETQEAKDLFNNAEYDSMRADIAASYFYNGKVDKALELASASAARSGKDVPLAGWIAGLASWREGQYANAAAYFTSAANSSRISAWMCAAASHWAARSYLRSHQPEKVSYWLHRSAEYPRTFYGIISMKVLGMEQARFNWNVPDAPARRLRELAALPAGRRAIALIDAERPDLAEEELRQINPGDDYDLQAAMIALASEKGMPDLALRLGSTFRRPDGGLYDAALYPDAPWEPAKGFAVDKALVYAFIRQESKFDPDAANRSSGAQGLMQLMPATARHVSRVHGEDISHDRLQDPVLNIDLGQKYLKELLGNEYVDNNLFKLAVAYNAGPGKLARWEQNAHYDADPLMFIESIPVAETRIFVERVMANFWIYRLKYDQDTASLDRVAEGDWPVYAAQDNRRLLSMADASVFFSH